jgi:NADP-dependent 3-hydroxy acid dehydrogenase YdfG
VSNFVSKTWKKVDILIHNAGSLLHKNFTEISSQEFQNIYKVNVFAVAANANLLSLGNLFPHVKILAPALHPEEHIFC